MKEILKNKLFIIFSLFIILISFIIFPSFANVEISNTDKTFIISDEMNSYRYKFLIIQKRSFSNGTTYYDTCFIFSDETFTVSFSPADENLADVPTFSHTGNLYYYKGSGSSSTFADIINNNPADISSLSLTSLSSDYTFNGFNIYRGSSNQYYSIITNTYYSNFDILETNNNNHVVFQAAPQQVEQVTEVMIPAIQQVEEIPQGMNQVLQVIIPIGLIVLSIGLVVYLTRLVIYRMKS